MATIDESALHALDPLPSLPAEHKSPGRSATGACTQNVGDTERKVSVAAGAALAVLGLARRDLRGLLLAGVGGGLVYRGATGHCYTYDALGINTAEDQSSSGAQGASHEIHVTETFLIDKSREELYKFWRNLENLAAIMTHLQSVTVIDDRRSHWVADAPAIAGGSVEWDAEITEDVSNSRIAWRSLANSDIETRGSVQFSIAPGKRGTIVRVEMEYSPPAGRVGALVAKLFGNDPERLIREDVRNFKRIMEIGDVLTIEGQPRGSCAAGIGRLMS
jgi:uncharacterized membrane protein